MPKAPVWRGTRDLEQLKVIQRYNADKVFVETGWTGPYTTCQAAAPAIGQQIEGIKHNNLRVSEVEIIELDAGAGEIRVKLESPGNTFNQDDSVDVLGDPIYEVEWMELQKPLEAHPECGRLKPTRKKYNDNGIESPTGKQRTWDDWADLTGDDYDTTGDITLAGYKAYRARGVESYLVGQPVARRTTYYLRGVQTSGCYFRQDPPGACGAPLTGYEYLKTADRVTKEGNKRTRVEEWTGAEDWDNTLYPAS